MREALRLARKGGERVFPNPRVGCVIVRDGRVVGRGFHPYFGGPHAETQALRQAGASARGATAYCTLEPCCHENKKNPPCVPALVRAGVARVVLGARDPNPEVNGAGAARLKRAGLHVVTGVLGTESRALIRTFLANARRQRPRVVLKAAATLDGRIATSTGESKWITSPKARALGHRWRAQCDAILVGVGTVRADDPSLTAHGSGRNPLRVVLDSRLRTQKSAHVLDGSAATILFTAKRERPARWGRAYVLHAERRGAGLDLRAVLARLSGMGVGSVLVEGGPSVAGSLLDSGLVDELRLFLAPRLIGGATAPSFYGGRGARRLAESIGIRELRVQRIGSDLLLIGRLRHGR